MQIITHLCNVCTKCSNKSAKQAGWLQPLPICVLQIGIWIKWSWRCPKGEKRRLSLTWPDLPPEQTFKMRINLVRVGAGGCLKQGWTVEDEAGQILFCFLKTRSGKRNNWQLSSMNSYMQTHMQSFCHPIHSAILMCQSE